MSNGRFIWCILTHQAAEAVERMIETWGVHAVGDILVLYGGAEIEFEKISHPLKCMVQNAALLTKDHQRERQSYAKVFSKAAECIDLSEYDYVYFTEFDQVPISKGLDEKLQAEMEARQVDLLCYGLKRIDKTNHPHWLNHKYDENFSNLVDSITVREGVEIILTCYGFGQCWKSEAFLSVSKISQSVPVYLELWIPTLAYHLGYKVGDIGRDHEWNLPLAQFELRDLAECKQKPWFIHPIKTLWISPRAALVD